MKEVMQEMERSDRMLRMKKRRNTSFFVLILCMVMLFSGCNSIIVNGDLSFKAYEPVEPMSAEEGIKKLVFGEVDMEKYGIGGTDAFFMLPNHLNPIYVEAQEEDPIPAEFKVLDYVEETGDFVYAYFVPYFLPKEELEKQKNSEIAYDMPCIQGPNGIFMTGISINPYGNADNVVLPSPEGTEYTGDYVMVLMSYNPVKHNYNVFYCDYIPSDDYDTLMPTLIAGKVGGDDSYFIYYDDVVMIFDRDGEVISNNNYSGIIMQKCRVEAFKNYGFTFYNNTRFTITNVDVDSNYVTYITVQIETSDKDLAAADKEASKLLDDDADIDESEEVENDESYEEIGGVKYFYATFACMSLDVGENSSVKFVSSLKEGKIDELKKIASDNKTITPSESEVNEIRSRLTSEKTDMAMAAYNAAVTTQQLDYEKKVDEAKKNDTEIPPSPTPLPFPAIASPTDDEIWNEIVKNRNKYIADVPEISDSKSLEEAFYKDSRVLNIMNNDFSTFDTSEMKKEGINLDISLAGIMDTNGIEMEVNGRTYKVPSGIQKFSGYRIGTYFLWHNFYNNKYYHVDYSSYLAARTGLTVEYLEKKFFEGDVSELFFLHSDLYGQMMYNTLELNVGHYFRAYGDKIRYPMLTPGEFNNKTKYSWRTDNLSVINQSPLKDVEEVADSKTGFYSVGKKDSEKMDIFNIVFFGSFPTVLAYMELDYGDGKEEKNYYAFDIDARVGDVNNFALPKMEVYSSQEIDLSRRYVLSWNGREIDLVSRIEGKVEIPTAYRMVFPKGTTMYMSGNTWINDYVKASEDMGAIVYHIGPRRWWKIWGTEGRWDDLSSSKKYIDLSDKKTYCEISQGKNKEDGLIWDQYVLGETVTDVGSYTVTGAIGQTHGIVAYFTDTLVRFYTNIGRKRYQCYMQMKYEELKQATGYGLIIDEDIDASGLSGTDKISQQALEDETPLLLMSHNLRPYSDTQFFLYNDDNGIRLLNLLPETEAIRLFSVLNGHYYAVFPTKNRDKFMVVGFQTEQYSYTDTDVSMAKMYLLDLGSIVRAKSGENINSYIDELRDYYHSVTHTILSKKQKGTDEVTYEIVAPSSSDENYTRAKRLFTGDSATSRKELDAICEEYGIKATDSIKTYAENVAQAVTKQRNALTDYYELIGIKMKDYGIPDTWQYLKREGEVFAAPYKEYLEIVLVEIILSDDYINTKITHRISNDKMLGISDTGTVLPEYEDYRKQYKEWLVSRTELDNIMEGKDQSHENIETTIIDLYRETADQELIESLTQMEFYKLVLNDLKKKYSEGIDQEDEDALTWDENIEALFKDISPDYGTDPFADMQKNGLNLFFTISGLPRMDGAATVLPWNEDDLIEEISKCRYDYQIEEIIIKYSLKLGINHEKLKWHDSWETYVKGSYKDEEERVKALENSDCYDIIRQRKAAISEMVLGKSWEEAVSNVLRDAGNGISRQRIEMVEEE